VSSTQADGPVNNDNVAFISVRVPVDAEVRLMGTTMRFPTGSLRNYVSPPLKPGRDFRYQITALWWSAGKEHRETREVAVKAGDHLTVDFLTGHSSPHGGTLLTASH
jgi:uncharacterized protein (TIGR03000 family)